MKESSKSVKSLQLLTQSTKGVNGHEAQARHDDSKWETCTQDGERLVRHKAAKASPSSSTTSQTRRRAWKETEGHREVLLGRLAPTPQEAKTNTVQELSYNIAQFRDGKEASESVAMQCNQFEEGKSKLKMAYYNIGDMQFVRLPGEKHHDYHDHSESLRHVSECAQGWRSFVLRRDSYLGRYSRGGGCKGILFV